MKTLPFLTTLLTIATPMTASAVVTSLPTESTFNFEDFDVGSDPAPITGAIAGRFHLQSTNTEDESLVINSGEGASSPEGDGIYLQVPSGGGFEITSVIAPFEALTIDLAELATVFPTATTVTFFGDRSDGSVVAQTFTTDGLTTPSAFETFTFDDDFTDLVRLGTTTDLFSADNLRMRAIPEPGASALLLLAGALTALRRRPHTQHSH